MTTEKSPWGHGDECIIISNFRNHIPFHEDIKTFKLIIQMSETILENSERVMCIDLGRL